MFKYAIIAAVAMFSGETQAVKVGVESKIQMKTQIDAAIDSYLSAESNADAEWGFLKNIVNIDRFFDSGVKA
jgi:hypothetical protein